MAEIKTNIVISGREYTIVSAEDGEYVNRVAYELNRRVKETNTRYVGLTTVTATDLTALNLTDELLKAKEALFEAQKQLRELSERLRQLEIELNLSLEKSENMGKSEEAAYKKRIRDLEKEVELLKNERQQVKPFRGYGNA